MRNVFDQYAHPENKLTHALLYTLDSDHRLLRRFINCARHGQWVEGRTVVEFALAVLAIVGTLAGTFLGSWLQSRQVREQRVHEDRTRFHTVRLETYSTLLAVLRKFSVFIYRWRDRLATPLTSEERAFIDGLQDELWITIERVALLAATDVSQTAEEMYSDVNLLVRQVMEKSTDRERLDALNTYFGMFFRKRDALRAAMRTDLGVGAPRS